jgi:Leucine-rich repeat (LRR) protein
MSQNRLSQIQDKLQELIKKDAKRKIFGADKDSSGHGYHLNPIRPKLDLNVFESANQITLPEEYRTFITQIADGGAGPYYGLLSLERGIEEAKAYSTNENTPIENSFTTDFPVSKKETDKFMAYYSKCIKNGQDDAIKYMKIPVPLTGVIFLSDYGCGWSYFLVVKGELAGTIWFHGDYLCPSFADGKLWNFFDWYEDWLDNSLEELTPKSNQKKTTIDVAATIINYNGWKLKEIPSEVFECKNLKKLVFSLNELVEFPKKIAEFTELIALDLSMNPFVEIPDEIGELKKLKKLNLNYNYHTTLPDALAKLSKLQELSMYYNYKIKEIPEVVGKTAKLKTLHISHCNELAKIAENIGDLSHLETLLLNDNDKLTRLPESIGSLKKLKHLDISRTNIKTLPQSISKLQNLAVLGISIDDLDMEDVINKIKHLPNLHTLIIVNQLELPASLCELTALKTVTLNQNYTLTRAGHTKFALAENITLIPNLETLDLTNNNQCNSLPKSIDKLKYLKKIALYSTAIKRFPDGIQHLTALTHVEGNLDDASDGIWGILPTEKEKLMQWFPKAKIQIW